MKWLTFGIQAFLRYLLLLVKHASSLVDQKACAHKLATTLISHCLCHCLVIANFFNQDNKMENWKAAKEAIQVQVHLPNTIAGQPCLVMTNHLIKLLKQIVANVSMSFHGEKHRQTKFFVSNKNYARLLSKLFVILMHPCFYPATVFTDDKCKRKMSQCKVKIQTYEVCTVVVEGKKTLILSKVEPMWIEEFEDETMGYFDITVHEIINHMHNHGEDLNIYEKAAMMKDRNHPCDLIEHALVISIVLKRASSSLLKWTSLQATTNTIIKLWLLKKILKFDKIINKWDKIDPHDWICTELKKFVPTECAKLKLKADECSMKANRFGITTNVNKVVKFCLLLPQAWTRNLKLPKRNLEC